LADRLLLYADGNANTDDKSSWKGSKREFGGLQKKWQQDDAFSPIATHLGENFRIIVNLACDAVLSFQYLRGGEYLRCQSGEPVEPDPDDTGGGTRCRAKFPAWLHRFPATKREHATR
jgi:hypothetical protein|tara:strand:+ start:717 stop:1070 length:354 start_codon:yes stop_codon:yes gene_type:complete